MVWWRVSLFRMWHLMMLFMGLRLKCEFTEVCYCFDRSYSLSALCAIRKHSTMSTEGLQQIVDLPSFFAWWHFSAEHRDKCSMKWEDLQMQCVSFDEHPVFLMAGGMQVLYRLLSRLSQTDIGFCSLPRNQALVLLTHTPPVRGAEKRRAS